MQFSTPIFALTFHQLDRDTRWQIFILDDIQRNVETRRVTAGRRDRWHFLLGRTCVQNPPYSENVDSVLYRARRDDDLDGES